MIALLQNYVILVLNKSKIQWNLFKTRQNTYNHQAMVNICIVYEISKNFNISSYQTLENCLLGAVSLTKNADFDKYKYSGYGIGFDRKGKFSVGNGFARICILFGVDMSSSVYVNSDKKDILILGEVPSQVFDDTILTPEKKYLIDFTENNKKFCLSL